MPRKRAGAPQSGFAILIVDDQEETLISGKLLLEREGHEVLTAPSGAAALSIFQANKIDLLIVDYFMPRMSGEELVRQIRLIDHDVQIVLQTGYSGEKPPREMLKLLDIQGYHDKSEGPDRLLLWVDVSLKAAAQLRRIREHERELLDSRARLRQLSARLLTLQEDERERISRELHDQLGQLLTAIGLDVDWARERAGSAVQERLAEAGKLVREAIEETRELCSTLRPGDLRGSRLTDALRTYAEESASRAGIELHVEGGAEAPDFPQDQARNIFRIVQEALSNITRHASATAAKIQFAHLNGDFVIAIEDNGKGFDPARISDPHAVGLVGMNERALLIGAKLDIQSAPGKGTSVRLQLPRQHKA